MLNYFKKIICLAIVGEIFFFNATTGFASYFWFDQNYRLIQKHTDQNAIQKPNNSTTKLTEAIVDDNLPELQNLIIKLNIDVTKFLIPIINAPNASKYSFFSDMVEDDYLFKELSLLDFAVLNRAFECTRFLLLSNTELTNNEKNVLSMYAVASGDMKIIRFLEVNNVLNIDIESVYVAARMIYSGKSKKRVKFLNWIMEQMIPGKLTEQVAERIISILLFAENEFDNDITEKTIWFNCGIESILSYLFNSSIKGNLSYNIISTILAAPKTNFPLYNLLKIKFQEFILKNKKQNVNFVKELGSNIIKNYFNELQEYQGIKNTVDLINSHLSREERSQKLDLDLGPNALSIAISKNDKDLVKDLIYLGADVNAKNSNGTIPIFLAASVDSPEIMDLLIENGADVNLKNQKGETPLHIASQKNNAKVILTLLSHMANINEKDNEGCTPLYLAVKENNFEATEILVLNNANIDETNNTYCAPIHLAVENNSINIVTLLTSKNAKVNVSRFGGFTPLHIACTYGSKKMVKLLIDSGAKFNATNISGQTPLHLALSTGNAEAAKMLIKSGANVNIKDLTGSYPIHIAVQICKIDLIKSLILSGANINVKDGNGNTPLHIAASYNREKLCEFLIKNGASQNLKNYSEELPFLYMPTEN